MVKSGGALSLYSWCEHLYRCSIFTVRPLSNAPRPGLQAHPIRGAAAIFFGDKFYKIPPYNAIMLVVRFLILTPGTPGALRID